MGYVKYLRKRRDGLDQEELLRVNQEDVDEDKKVYLPTDKYGNFLERFFFMRKELSSE